MSRLSIKIFCVIAILQFVTGCISFTPAVGYDASPQPEVGYIYGRFVLNEQISSPLPSKMGLVLQEQHTDSTYTIKFKPVETSVYRDGVWITKRVDVLTSLIAVKPGTYALKKLGGKSLVESPLTKPFVVDAGKAYYVADFAVQSSEVWLPGLAYAYSWKVDAISDNYESTTAEFKAKFPRLSLLPTARALSPSEDVFRAQAGQNGPQWGTQFATPGSHVKLAEVSRQPRPTNGQGIDLVTYEVVASGLSSDKQYELWLKRSTTTSPTKRAALRLRLDGTSHATVKIYNFAKGERLEVGVIATDGSVKTFADAYPYPLEARDGPCHLALTLASSKGDMFVVDLDGFPPLSAVEIKQSSGDEAPPPLRQTVDANGRLLWLTLPAARGEHRASIAVEGERCKVALDYFWGPEAVDPSK